MKKAPTKKQQAIFDEGVHQGMRLAIEALRLKDKKINDLVQCMKENLCNEQFKEYAPALLLKAVLRSRKAVNRA
jgi:transcriptional regulator NrdR family protein